MRFLEVVHRALDYFFCDRCPFECSCNEMGDESRLWLFIGDKLCPIMQLWPFLPEEKLDGNHPIRFPRSWLGKVVLDQGKQNEGGVRE